MDLGVFLFSALSACLIALGIVLTQFGLRHLSALAGAAVSIPTSATMFLVMSFAMSEWSGWQHDSAITFAIAGLFYPAAVTLLNFTSNRRLGPNMTAAMGNLTPLFAVALAVLALGEVPTTGQVIGIFVILSGLFLLASDRRRAFPAASLWLILIPLSGAVLRGSAQPLVKFGLQGWPSALAAATIGYVVSAGVIWTACLFIRSQRGGYSRRSFAWFVAIGICNGLALLTLYAALERGSVTAVAPVVATYPLITFGMSRLIHRDATVSLHSLAGIAMSVLGVILLVSL
ncbi:EamA family transporter [Arenibacterium sp. CAU 1754]